ncbi:cytochrome c [Actibacterium sp. MT2.3-13A]|uniref:c-type cytochrome n=1 Tax=Actibacterium sp. MT2.3-13A TaxID=2828332 RepID=UPI001BA54D8F|nr:cytochrome c [Actibacterium sp. MT2.3-13A]
MPAFLKWGLAVAALIVVGGAGVVQWPVDRPVPPIPPDGAAARGAYLARAAGCIACHTDSARGGAPLAGGAPIETPFGGFVPPNLTTDPGHGIGAWTAEDFARAVRQGLSPGGEPYYPAFPYAFYAHLSDRDIADLWAAFRTVPPVAEPAPGNAVDFPFDQRAGLKLWRAAFLEAQDTAPVPGRSEDWNRGRWLVEGVAHCGACHTDRNALGARRTEARLEGSDDLPGGKRAPAITPAALARAGWSVETLSYALKSGVRPDGDVFGAGMGEVVAQGTAWLEPADRRAMAIYLMDERPVRAANGSDSE